MCSITYENLSLYKKCNIPVKIYVSFSIIFLGLSITYFVHSPVKPLLKYKAKYDANTVGGHATPGLDEHVVPVLPTIHTAPGDEIQQYRGNSD